MSGYEIVRSIWWELRSGGYLFSVLYQLLNIFPGESGNKLRGYVISKYLGKAGNNIQINRGVILNHINKLEIGDNFIINAYSMIEAGGKVKIGDNVLIGPGVKVWSINHKCENTNVLIKDQGWVEKEVVIGNDVWIGMNAVILPGVIIPEGVVIAAAAVVTTSMSLCPYTIYAGNPIKKIKSRII